MLVSKIIIAATRRIRFVLIGYLQCSCCPIKYILFRMDIADDDRLGKRNHHTCGITEPQMLRGEDRFQCACGRSMCIILCTASTYNTV